MPSRFSHVFHDDHSLQFAAPQWLWFTAAAVLLTAALFWISAKARRRQLAEFADPGRRAALLASHSPAMRVVKNTMLFLALLLVGIALARPQWGEMEERVDRKGDDVVFLMDTSKSMLATDVTPNRLERAKMAVLDFLRRHAGGRVGLVAFAGDAFLQCPAHARLRCIRGIHPRDSTATRCSCRGRTSQARFSPEAVHLKNPSAGKILVLVTDGEDLERAGIDAAKKLAKDGVVVFAMGVGTPNGGISRCRARAANSSRCAMRRASR